MCTRDCCIPRVPRSSVTGHLHIHDEGFADDVDALVSSLVPGRLNCAIKACVFRIIEGPRTFPLTKFAARNAHRFTRNVPIAIPPPPALASRSL